MVRFPSLAAFPPGRSSVTLTRCGTYPCRVKFLSRKGSAPATPVTPPASESPTAPGKGRPTPTRKEAEAARKHHLKVPTDPKEAKKAAKARAAEERYEARVGMQNGDERYLPARDQGPARAWVRDYVDSRWAVAELFLPMAIIVLALGFMPFFAGVQGYVSMAWLLLTVVMVIDTILLTSRMRRRMRPLFPEPADRKGVTLYAVMRALQLRRLRLPKPKVRPGGRPVKVKAEAEAEAE